MYNPSFMTSHGRFFRHFFLLMNTCEYIYLIKKLAPKHSLQWRAHGLARGTRNTSSMSQYWWLCNTDNNFFILPLNLRWCDFSPWHLPRMFKRVVILVKGRGVDTTLFCMSLIICLHISLKYTKNLIYTKKNCRYFVAGF